ncbi:callose synthase-like protein, partial [Trifolium pratense]
VCEHAHSLSQKLDPNSEGRSVLQFKTSLMSVIKQKKEDGIIDTSKDINQLQEFYESYRKKNNIVDEEEMEMHFRESGEYVYCSSSSILKRVIESDSTSTEDLIAYNIIPIDATSSTEVQAAVSALKYFTALPKLPNAYFISPTRSANIFDFLQYTFGFQKDNVANQREHIVHLLANEQSRLGVFQTKPNL